MIMNISYIQIAKERNNKVIAFNRQEKVNSF